MLNIYMKIFLALKSMVKKTLGGFKTLLRLKN